MGKATETERVCQKKFGVLNGGSNNQKGISKKKEGQGNPKKCHKVMSMAECDGKLAKQSFFDNIATGNQGGGSKPSFPRQRLKLLRVRGT